MNLTINQGENAVIRRDLKYQDGTTDLLVDDLASAKVRLKNAYVNLDIEYVYPATVFRKSAAAQLEIEITDEVSLALPLGPIQVELELQVPNPSFISDQNIIDFIKEEFTVSDGPTSGTHIDTATAIAQIPLSIWLASGTWKASSSTIKASSGD